MEAVRRLRITRIGTNGETAVDDDVAVEEPLEIRIGGDTLAVTMRTPGRDRELALGLLWAEGIIASLSDVASVVHCGRTGDEARENVLDVTPAPGSKIHFPEEHAARRGTITSSACGVCGRKSIDDLVARCAPVPRVRALRTTLFSAVESLRATQPLFARTGGCHGAALLTLEGDPVVTFEDVGRHNAVDKVVGSALLAGRLPLSSHMLVVSGRTSFEIVQKAVAAGIPVVCGVSAASSLAIDTATRAGLILAGFVRGQEMVVYAGGDRVD